MSSLLDRLVEDGPHGPVFFFCNLQSFNPIIDDKAIFFPALQRNGPFLVSKTKNDNMKRLIIPILLLLSVSAFAQEDKFKEHFIEVTGTAYREIEPNEIYIVIRLKEFEENRQKIALEQLDKDFFKAVRTAGIERERVTLADAGSDLEKFRRRDKESYRDKSYQIILHSATELEKLIEALSAVKVDAVDITRLHHTDYEKIRMELKIEALKAARTKAEALLSAIGSGIGKPLMIRDFDFAQPYMEMKANIRTMNMDAAQAPDPVAFRKIRLQAQITAQFEIL